MQCSQVAFPGNLQLVLILRPSRFLQRTLTDLGVKYYRDELKTKVPVSAPLVHLAWPHSWSAAELGRAGRGGPLGRGQQHTMGPANLVFVGVPSLLDENAGKHGVGLREENEVCGSYSVDTGESVITSSCHWNTTQPLKVVKWVRSCVNLRWCLRLQKGD